MQLIILVLTSLFVSISSFAMRPQDGQFSLILPVYIEGAQILLNGIADYKKESCDPSPVIQALKRDYAAMVTSQKKLTVLRDRWAQRFFSMISTCLVENQRIPVLYKSGFLAMRLYPDLNYSQTAQKITEMALAAGLEVDIKKFDRIQSPQDCAPISLLTKETSKGVFRPIDQGIHATCYAYTATRALDYLNYSMDFKQPLTSVVGAILTSRVDRVSNDLDVDYGYASKVDQALTESGGCGLSEIDSVLGTDLFILEKVKRELQDVLLNYSKNTSVEAIQARLSPESQNFLARALTSDMNEMVGVTTFKLAKYVYRLAQIYQKNLNSKNQFMTFADFIYRKAYCKKPVKYVPHSFTPVLGGQGARYFGETWNQAIGTEFSKPNPQPLMMAFCSEAFGSVEPMGSCSSHLALIVGRDYEPKTKQCQYQILNSWGNAPAYHELYRQDLNQGVVWLPVQQIGYSGTHLSVLEPK